MRSPGPILLMMSLLLGCATPIVVHPPADRPAREALALREVTRLGQPGDWLVMRGYHATDNLVSALTAEPFSHVAVLDAEHNQVIEAEGRGLHTAPLADFLHRAHRVILMRPMWATTPERQRAAVEKARSLVGRPYDFTGLIGLNVADRYYCSELAVAAYAPHASRKDRLPLVIPPGDMHFWATILWDSGPVPTSH
ncbi:MAG: hypothetical protein HXX12_00085 [Geothrix sp.]|uniref:YiiX/YebB-like N1pC/P60 family cysteine hydrolase n=1 Tax=Geothrix sp. TaxID=1962974 RepID=UPI00180D4EEF|nr:YiiX/YebB-like N1pC/P60 family cysteine hydrolase [Geothrix sp.]NWJ39353.1 hypothetical protein [Geothrix sp.]WIL19422.1 MAG: hypothetical protein QOZ81_001937 [Geothrix sp.]